MGKIGRLFVSLLAVTLVAFTYGAPRCSAGGEVKIDVYTVGNSIVLDRHVDNRVPVVSWPIRPAHLSLGGCSTIKVEPGAKLIVAIREGQTLACGLTVTSTAAADATSTVTSTAAATAASSVTSTAAATAASSGSSEPKCSFQYQKDAGSEGSVSEQTFGVVPYAGSVTLRFVATGCPCVTCPAVERSLTIEPAPAREYTPLASYVFAKGSKPTYGMAQPLKRIGTIFGQPVQVGSLLGAGTTDQKGFVGPVFILQLHWAGRYAETPSKGLPVVVSFAIGARGVRLGEGNPGNDLFMSFGLSLFLE